MRCSTCTAHECEGDYDLRHRCTEKKEGIKCTCKCHITAVKYALTNGGSIIGGVGMIIGKKKKILQKLTKLIISNYLQI